jgi:hypothetical protein
MPAVPPRPVKPWKPINLKDLIKRLPTIETGESLPMKTAVPVSDPMAVPADPIMDQWVQLEMLSNPEGLSVTFERKAPKISGDCIVGDDAAADTQANELPKDSDHHG